MAAHYVLLGRDLIPCDVYVWGEWFEQADRTVGWWHFRSCEVSTVCLGIVLPSDPPLPFETMIFGGPLNMTSERYATYDEAELGHLYHCGQVIRYEVVTHWRKLKRWRNQLRRNRRLRSERIQRFNRESEIGNRP